VIYLALGAAVLWFLVGLGRGQAVFRRREWRLFSGVLSLAAFIAAAFVGLRGAWEISIVLVILGIWMVMTARVNPRAAPPPSSKMTDEEARSLLGVGPDAAADEIQAAYTRLMRMAHPDKGGTTGLATQLNAARDRLLRD
jgi:hypothetical protein